MAGLFDDPLVTGARRPVPRAAVVLALLALGIALGRAFEVPSSVSFSVAAGGCALAAALGGRACRAALAVALVALGTGWHVLRLVEVGPDDLTRAIARATPDHADHALMRLEGIVDSRPRLEPSSRHPLNSPAMIGDRVRFEITVRRVIEDDGPRRAVGRVRAAAPPDLRLAVGDRVRVVGRVRAIAAPANPGELDARPLARQAGIVASLSIPDADLVEILPPGDGPALDRLARRARDTMRASASGVFDRLVALSSQDGAALTRALLLGERHAGFDDVHAPFTRVGLAHLLAISGFHLAVLAGVVLILLRALGDLGWIEPVLVVALVLLYLAVLPVNAPIWRAGIMIIALAVADALGRRHDRLALLAWAAILLLLWKPAHLWSMGAQLSFGLVATLIWLGVPFHNRLWGVRLSTGPRPEPAAWRFPLEWLKRLVSTTLLCWAVAIPTIAFHTGVVSALAVPATILVLPLVMAILVVGHGGVVLGALVPALREPASHALAWLADAAIALVRALDAIPGASWRIPPISLALAVVATIVVLYWIIAGHRRDRVGIALAAAVALWTLGEWWLTPALPARTLLRIDTLAVGDGTCHVVRSGREAILWDCGSLTPGIGERVVPRAVRALGLPSVPAVIVTHPNLDHYNGILDAAPKIGLRTVYLGSKFADVARARPNGPEAYFLRELDAMGLRVVTLAAGDTIALGRVVVTILAPPSGAAWPGVNDHSLVARIAPAQGSHPAALMTGDIEAAALAHLASLAPRAAVIELPHHGSAQEPAIALVMRLDPAVVLQSTGPSRAGDPRWAHLRSTRAWFTTAADGAAWAEIARDGSIRAGRSVR